MRQVSKYLKLSLILVGVTVFSLGKAQQMERPNIIVFFVDDLGWQDISVPFYKEKTEINRKFHTPSLEDLAKESTKFTNAYATPVCTPSRVSMLTGLNAAHHKVTNWTHPVANIPTDNPDSLLSPPNWNINGMSPVANTPRTVYATPFPQILKDNGYYTVHVGKAHWGAAGTPAANPMNLGFMINVGGHSAGHPQSYYAKDNYGNIPKNTSYQAVPDLIEYYGGETFLTEALTLEAVKAISEPIRRKEPFFLHFSNYAVHVPIQPDPRFVQKYLDKGMDSIEAGYASLVEGFDKSIGDIVGFLKAKGVYENTVIIFLSDNGGLSLQPMRSGPNHTQNLPLKAGKGSIYEGGIRVPLLIKNVKGSAAITAESPVIIEDLFPTILELAHINEYATVQNRIDGVSLVSLIEGKKDKSWNDRSLIWNTPNKWTPQDGPGINFFSAIRQGDFKLVYDIKKGNLELYNLKDDIGETKDISSINRSKVKKLSIELTRKLKEWDAQLPVYRSSGKIVPFPDQLH